MEIKTNHDLEEYVRNLYSKVEAVAREDNVFHPLKAVFSDKLPLNYQGMYYYVESDGYHYCAIERGITYVHEVTTSLFDISYWIINGEISLMASDYKSKHEIPGQSFRRVMFAEKKKLFQQIGGEYAQRAEQEIEEILRDHPYKDSR